jgi:hypothetical protein
MRGPDYEKRPAPCCGYAVDSATIVGADTVRPQAGDFSVCLRCGTWLRFADDVGALRMLTAEDWLDIDEPNHALLTKATALIRAGQER